MDDYLVNAVQEKVRRHFKMIIVVVLIINTLLTIWCLSSVTSHRKRLSNLENESGYLESRCSTLETKLDRLEGELEDTKSMVYDLESYLEY